MNIWEIVSNAAGLVVLFLLLMVVFAVIQGVYMYCVGLKKNKDEHHEDDWDKGGPRE